MSKITVRDATKDDTEFARLVHHQAYKNVIEKQFGPWDEEFQNKMFYENWGNPGFQIIDYDNVPCGYTRTEYLPTEVRGQELVILPKFQNKGIGTSMLKKLINDAKERKVPARLQVLKENRAQELYKRIGFNPIGETGTHVIMEYNEL